MHAPSRHQVVSYAKRQDRKEGQPEEPERAERQHAREARHRRRKNRSIGKQHQALVRFLFAAKIERRRNKYEENRHVTERDSEKRQRVDSRRSASASRQVTRDRRS